MKKNRSLFSIVLMIFLTGVTQILAVLKSSLVAGQFGASVEMDSYNLANSVVSFLFGFVASAIPTIVIPEYINKKHIKQTNAFVTALYGGAAVIIALVFLLRFRIVAVFSGRDKEFINLTCEILLILLLSNLLFSLTYLTTAYFQCIEKYNIPKAISLISQLFVVLVLLVSHNLTIIQYAWIISVGLLLNCVVDAVIALKNGWRYNLSFTFQDEKVKQMFVMFFPLVFSTGVYRVSLLVDSVIASRLEVGYLTVLGYSNQIAGIVNSLLVGNLLIYCYPKIIKHISYKDSKVEFWKQTSFFHLVIWFVIAAFSTVGREGISILFEHGKFSSSAATKVYVGALIYIVGQQTNIVRDLMYRYFYALGDTKPAASNSILVSFTNIVVSVILVSFIGFYGIILGTVIASFVSMVRFFMLFSRKIGLGESLRTIIKSLTTNIVIALITIVIVYLTKSLVLVESLVLCIFIFGIETVVVFVLLTVLIKKDIFAIIKSI